MVLSYLIFQVLKGGGPNICSISLSFCYTVQPMILTAHHEKDKNLLSFSKIYDMIGTHLCKDVFFSLDCLVVFADKVQCFVSFITFGSFILIF